MVVNELFLNIVREPRLRLKTILGEKGKSRETVRRKAMGLNHRRLNVDGSRLPQEAIDKHFYEPSLGSFLFAFLQER